MAATPLGGDRLVELFQRSCRLAVANETDAENAVSIVAAAFVLHQEDASTQTLTFFDLDIGPQDSGSFDNDRPSRSPVVLVEALIRMTVDEGGMVDAYAAAAHDPQQALRGATFGIKAIDGVLAPDEHVVPSSPRFAVFGRPSA